MVQDLAVPSGRLCMCHGSDDAEREYPLPFFLESGGAQLADTAFAFFDVYRRALAFNSHSPLRACRNPLDPSSTQLGWSRR